MMVEEREQRGLLATTPPRVRATVLINQGFDVFGHERLVSNGVGAAKHPRSGVTIRDDDASFGRL